ncbi:MAG TPA: peptidoglycan-associated lipoprotein Pal [Acetobacteraceae bacterium]|nr:peptidoglycan-associated lipoprotein Pal [Acetobacteraceae bacterium]
MRSSVILAALLAVSLAACSSDNLGTNGGSGGVNPYGANGAAGAGGPGGYASGNAAPGSEEDLVGTVGDRIFFNTDRSDLSDEARATLDKQAAWLQRYPNVRIMIAGNCDERGTEEYNLALGERRARADAQYLVAHGVSANRIQTISYGKDRPTDPASTPEAWAKNRNAITMVQ